jgi:hypothetical protein
MGNAETCAEGSNIDSAIIKDGESSPTTRRFDLKRTPGIG